jgi:hypothetical protein
MGAKISVARLWLSACRRTFDVKQKGRGSRWCVFAGHDELRNFCVGAKSAWLTLRKAGYEQEPAEEEMLNFACSFYC